MIPTYEEERFKIVSTILIVFLGLLFLIIFQFALHHSQTKDLQRRIGALEAKQK